MRRTWGTPNLPSQVRAQPARTPGNRPEAAQVYYDSLTRLLWGLCSQSVCVHCLRSRLTPPALTLPLCRCSTRPRRADQAPALSQQAGRQRGGGCVLLPPSACRPCSQSMPALHRAREIKCGLQPANSMQHSTFEPALTHFAAACISTSRRGRRRGHLVLDPPDRHWQRHGLGGGCGRGGGAARGGSQAEGCGEEEAAARAGRR